MLIAEDLLLLVTDDASGRLTAAGEQVDIGLAGANLLELALLNKVDLSGDRDGGRPGRLVVRDSTPTGDAVLDEALGQVAEHQGDKPATVLRPLSRDLRRRLYQRLAGTGVLRAEDGRILGIFPTHRWPARNANHEAQVRRDLVQALVEGTTPDARTAALIALTHALRCEEKAVDAKDHSLTKRELRARAAQIANGDWASAAVRTAIDQMTAAVVAATSSAVVLSGGTHG
ncbi:MAG TPA: GPP34 family phosphoprotein [Micromonosporaceae bacterium]